ncbi:MAG: hypothetical protein Fur0041_03150 [Bacteroidia bacterium]
MKPIRKLIYKILNRLLYSGRFGDIPLRKSLLDYLPDSPISYVDVGAYDGHFYEVIAAEKNISKAILIEPQNDFFNQLQLKYGTSDKVRLINAVITNEEKDVFFHENKLSATSSLLQADEINLGKEIDISGKTISKRGKNLDGVISDINYKIDLLKIDVQGAELEVLKGGSQTLKRTAFIWIEVSFKPLYKNSPLFEDIKSFLEDKGFIMLTILPGFKSKSGELLQADCLFKNTVI